MTAEIITLPGIPAPATPAPAPAEIFAIEPSFVPDTPAGELVRVDVFGEFSRLIFAIPERPAEGGQYQRIVCGKLLLPTSTLETIAAKILAAVPSDACRNEP